VVSVSSPHLPSSWREGFISAVLCPKSISLCALTCQLQWLLLFLHHHFLPPLMSLPLHSTPLPSPLPAYLASPPSKALLTRARFNACETAPQLASHEGIPPFRSACAMYVTWHLLSPIGLATNPDAISFPLIQLRLGGTALCSTLFTPTRHEPSGWRLVIEA